MTDPADESGRACPNCGVQNDKNAMRCARCGAPLVASTIAMGKSPLNLRTPTLQIVPDSGSRGMVSLEEDILTIGSRGASSRDVTVAAEGIAEYHARLKREHSTYRLYSLTANAVVLVNGNPVRDSHLLKNGDIIRLQNAQTQGATLIYENVFESYSDKGAGPQSAVILVAQFTIGRDPKSDLAIDSLTVSWNHARIETRGNTRQITDLRSTNGTRVNGILITTPTTLQAGDTIQIASFTYLYDGLQLRRTSGTPNIRLLAVGLEKTYQTAVPPRTQTTVEDVTVIFEPQEFVAIIGGSGSGKSTLLRMLNGVSNATSGHVYANNDDLYDNYALYQSVIGYVPQADIVHGDLTVYQGLWFAARLRFPLENEEARQQRVAHALDMLELSAVRGNLIHTLSGGQRKRVSIALELMAEPPLLFLDEPFSGLDPGLDNVMMRVLRRMADRGHTVIIVTHTTLNLELCDKILVMSAGRMTFFGAPKDALKFFGVNDYAEIYNVVQEPEHGAVESATYAGMLAARGGHPESNPREAANQWREAFKKTPLYTQNVVEKIKSFSARSTNRDTLYLNRQLQRSKRGSFAHQIRVLAHRTLALLRRDIVTLLLLVVVLPVIGIVLASMSFDRLVERKINNPDTRETFQRSQMFVPLEDENQLRELFTKWPSEVLPCTREQPTQEGEYSTCPTLPQENLRKDRPPDQRFKTYFHSVGTYAPAATAQPLVFMMTVCVTLLGLFAATSTIVTERTLFLRERLINLRISSYLGSKLLVYGGLALLSSLLLLLLVNIGVVYPVSGLALWGPLEMYITLALAALAGVSVGLAISALTRSPNAALAVAFAVLILQIVFSGVVFPVQGAFGESVSRLTVTRWAVESLGGTVALPRQDRQSRILAWGEQWRADPGESPRRMPPSPTPRNFPAASMLRLDYPESAAGLVARWGVLAGFSIVFVGVAYLALRQKRSF